MSEQLINALYQAYGINPDPRLMELQRVNAQNQGAVQPAMDEYVKARTWSRPSGHAGNILEGLVDGFRRPGTESRMNEKLMEAMSSQQGLDQVQGHIQALQAQAQLEAEREYDDYKFNRGQQGKSEIQRQKDEAALERAKIPKPGVTINTGERGPQVGSIPPGFELYRDPETGAHSMRPIEGSDAAKKREKQEFGEIGREAGVKNVVNTIDRAIGQVDGLSAGWGGKLKGIPSSDAKTLAADLSTIRGNLAFDRLQEMRNASTTGGALGQVSNIELGLLESTVAGLDQEMDPDALVERLNLVKQHYSRFTDALGGSVPDGYDVREVEGQQYIKVDGQWYPL